MNTSAYNLVGVSSFNKKDVFPHLLRDIEEALLLTINSNAFQFEVSSFSNVKEW
jgi:hypothetical protein